MQTCPRCNQLILPKGHFCTALIKDAVLWVHTPEEFEKVRLEAYPEPPSPSEGLILCCIADLKVGDLFYYADAKGEILDYGKPNEWGVPYMQPWPLILCVSRISHTEETISTIVMNGNKKGHTQSSLPITKVLKITDPSSIPRRYWLAWTPKTEASDPKPAE